MTGLYIGLGAAALLVALWLFLIGAKHSEGMNKFKNTYYAHRGLHGEHECFEDAAPENSLKAFERACEGGFGIELDVRQTKDGKIVVFHDDTLTRVCGIDGRVSDMTFAELQSARLLGTEEKIPLFKEVLALVSGRAQLLVEIKDDGYGASTVEKTMKLLSEYKGEYIVESFNPLILGNVKKYAPKVLRGFLCDKLSANPQYSAFKFKVVERHFLNFIARPHFIACSKENPKMFPIGIIRALFRPAFVAWTVKSAEEEKQARLNGFDGIIFEGYIPEVK